MLTALSWVVCFSWFRAGFTPELLIVLLNRLGQSHAPLPEDAGKQTIAYLDRVRNANGTKSTAQVKHTFMR